MGRKNKKKKQKRNYLYEWDNVMFSSGSTSYQSYTSPIFSHADSKEIHELATLVFGKTYYVESTSLQ